jgi:hypothetical protein
MRTAHGPLPQERRRTFRTITRTKEMVTIREGLSFGHFAGALLMERLTLVSG